MAKESEKNAASAGKNDEPRAAARTASEPQAEDTANPPQLQPYPDGNPQDPYAAKTIAHPKAMEDEEPPPPETTRKAPEPEPEARREKK